MEKLIECKVSSDDREDDIITLGVASVETKGAYPLDLDDSPLLGSYPPGMLTEE